jgi:serine/threonine-protein kinase
VVNTEPSAPTRDGQPAPSATAAATEWIGRVVADRYRVVEVLGEGGMGAVYVAEHLKLRKLVALKTIRPEFAGDGQAERRFEREAQATAKIDHPHVVSAMDYGHLPDGGAYLVVQLVRGQSLGKHLERGPLYWRQAAELGAQIADALATCHAAGVIHRDLKPDNILLEQRDDGSFHARVVDFGIARLAEEPGDGLDGTQPLTRMGSIIGTPGYMAPEQAVGQAIDHRVDLYALGVILWETCAGRRLWQGDTLTEMFARQLAGAAPPLREMLSGQVPENLSETIHRLLSPIAGQRPASAAAVRDELRRLAFSGDATITGTDLRASGSAFAVPPPTISPSFTASGTQITATRPELPLTVRLRVAAARLPRPVLLGGGAALVLVLALALRCACGGGSDEPAPPAPTPAPSEVPAAKPSKPARADTPKPAPKPAPKPEPDAPAPTPAPADPADVPAAFAKHANALLTGTSAKARKRAAEAITGASEADKTAIPEYLRNLAWLEKLRGCDDKKPILLKIEEAGDARALPGLQILAKTPRNGCGNFLFKRDCLECLRGDLGRVIGRFESEQAGP